MIPEDAIWILELIRNRDARTEAEKDAVNAAIEALKAQLSQECTTSDTISRQATIDAVNNAFDKETLLTGFVRSIAVRAIRDMPSVQPEPTDEQVEEYCKRRCLHIVTDDFFHTVQPEPQEGKWEQVSAQKYFTSASYFYRCSVCGENNPRNTKYCPNCGADMRGEKDG